MKSRENAAGHRGCQPMCTAHITEFGLHVGSKTALHISQHRHRLQYATMSCLPDAKIQFHPINDLTISITVSCIEYLVQKVLTLCFTM